MKAMHSAIVVLATMCLWIGPSNGMARKPVACEQRTILAQASSPDNAWVATIYNNVCSDGAFVTEVSDTVELTRPTDPMSHAPTAGTVFGMDDRPHGNARSLAVNWHSARNLEITIPNAAWASRQETHYADIAISYRYMPDDPIERACLKAWRSLPTDESVRRSQSPAENINAFLEKCRLKGGPD